MTTQTAMLSALQENPFFSKEEKRDVFKLSKNMSEESLAILTDALNARAESEFKSALDRRDAEQVRLKNQMEKDLAEASKFLYESAEEKSLSEDLRRQEELISDIDV